MVVRTLIASILMIAAGACQHNAAPVPAVLADDSPETMDLLRSHLASAMGQARISLGAGDPLTDSSVAVLPAALNPNEDRSTARPIIFDLMIEGTDCFAVRRGSDEHVPLPGLACRAA